MPKTTVFPFNPSHIGFTNNMVFVANKTRINWVAICDIKIRVPTAYSLPQKLKSVGTAITQNDTL